MVKQDTSNHYTGEPLRAIKDELLDELLKEYKNPDATNLDFCKTRAVTAATGVGLLGGLVGQGGSFILIPLMTAYVKITTRSAIGSNPGIVFLSSLAAFIGKATTGQIDWILTIPIALTVLCTSLKLPSSKSRCILSDDAGFFEEIWAIISVASERAWYSAGASKAFRSMRRHYY